MRQRFLNSLAFRLGLITLVSLVPAILVALSFSHDVREHIETEARLLASQKAERIAGVGREIVSGGRHELMALTRLHEIHTLNSPKARAVLHDAFLQSPNTLTYALYDLFGNAITASRPDVMPPSVKKEAWFQHVVASLTCSQGERAMTQLPANHLLVQACPVLKDSGDITGVLVLGIDFSWFQHAMRQLDLPPGSSAMVVDAHGVIVAQTLRDSANDAKVIPDAPRLMPLVAKGLTTQLAPGLDGVDRLYAFSRLTNQPGHELYVRVGIPVHKAYAQADYATRKSLAGLLLVALVSLIAAFLLSDTILKPSEDILEATKRLAEGDLSHRIHSQAKGELADLAHGVDTMADALETSTKALRQTEEKVRQILEHSVEGYFESTWEGRFVTANPAMLRMMGYDSLEQLDQHILSIAQQFYVQPHRRTELLDTLLRDGRVQGFEFESYRKDGSIYWTVLSARTLVDEDGNTIAIQGFASDISIRKQIEMELMRSNERFSARTGEPDRRHFRGGLRDKRGAVRQHRGPQRDGRKRAGQTLLGRHSRRHGHLRKLSP
jgi:PAS domain S-box